MKKFNEFKFFGTTEQVKKLHDAGIKQGRKPYKPYKKSHTSIIFYEDGDM